MEAEIFRHLLVDAYESGTLTRSSDMRPSTGLHLKDEARRYAEQQSLLLKLSSPAEVTEHLVGFEMKNTTYDREQKAHELELEGKFGEAAELHRINGKLFVAVNCECKALILAGRQREVKLTLVTIRKLVQPLAEPQPLIG